jgi:hypothetical protein
MNGLRTLKAGEETAPTICDCCTATGCPWDRIAGTSICPDCQERLIRGESEPMRFPSEERPCALCGTSGTLAFVTVPLHARAVAIDLCPKHLRALLARGLEPGAFLELARQLRHANLTPDRIFLLHEAFYDGHGMALKPVADAA